MFKVYSIFSWLFQTPFNVWVVLLHLLLILWILFQVSYTSENVVEGKRAAKEALQQRLGLKRADLPLVGIITRLTHQKGIHLIKHAIWRTLDRGGQVHFILLFFYFAKYFPLILYLGLFLFVLDAETINSYNSTHVSPLCALN